MIIAADAKCFYPSMDHRRSAEVIRTEVMSTNMKLDGFNWREAAKYICLSLSPTDWDRWGVRRLMPKRAKSGGVAPGITGAEAMGADTGSQQWEFRSMEPSQKQIKHLLAAVIAVAVLSTL